MFFKKKKEDDIVDEIVVSTTKKKHIEEEIIVPKKSRKDKKRKIIEEKQLKKNKKQKKQVIVEETVVYNFEWYDVDSCDIPKKESRRTKKKQSIISEKETDVKENITENLNTDTKDEETNDEISDEITAVDSDESTGDLEIVESDDQKNPTIVKKELHEYFLQSKEEQEKLKRKPPKKPQKSKNKFIGTDLSFRYKGKKFQKPEDFIKYLDAHYLDLEEIAFDLLNDKLFFTWIGKRSGLFPQSLKEFTKIKEKIENK